MRGNALPKTLAGALLSSMERRPGDEYVGVLVPLGI